MNASQSKALMNAARQALITIQSKAEHWDNPVNALRAIAVEAELAHLRLWVAIHEAEKAVDDRPAVKAPKRKAKKIPTAQYGEHRRDVECPKCEGECRLPKWLVMTERDGSLREIEHYDATTVLERLSYCACGGLASEHAKDEMDNLLECSHCRDCKQFHYATANEEQQAA
jgi:hypothetical protein